MKKVAGFILFLWGAGGASMQIAKSGGDVSKIAASVSVGLLMMALGVWLWQKK